MAKKYEALPANRRGFAFEREIQMEKQLLSIEQTAEMLSISQWTVRLYVKRGTIPSVKIGTRRLIRATDVDRIVSEGLGAANSSTPQQIAA